MKAIVPKLSIVIPCFNGEKYIKKCLDKVLALDINKEIIVIDDGSTDNSLNLLKKYKDKIILINVPINKGVSYARNLGINKASGDYITFIDIDDDFELNMHKTLLEKIITENSDLCICEYDTIELNGKRLKSKYSVNFGNITQTEIIKKYLTGKIFYSVCFSVYKKEITSNIKFNEKLQIGEDILFLLQYLMIAKKTSFIPLPLYHYVQRNTSAIHEISPKICQYFEIISYLSESEKCKLLSNYEEEFKCFNLILKERYVNTISFSSRKNKKYAFSLLKDKLTKRDCLDIVKNKYSYTFIRIEFLIIYLFGIKFHLCLFPIYTFLRSLFRKK